MSEFVVAIIVECQMSATNAILVAVVSRPTWVGVTVVSMEPLWRNLSLLGDVDVAGALVRGVVLHYTWLGLSFLFGIVCDCDSACMAV